MFLDAIVALKGVFFKFIAKVKGVACKKIFGTPFYCFTV